MTPKQMQDRVKAIIAATADRYGWTVSQLADKIEAENEVLVIETTRKVLYDRVRRAARSLAKLGLVEMRRTPETGVTFHPQPIGTHS